MALIHRRDQIPRDTIALQCPRCQDQYSGTGMNEILCEEELICPGCGLGGMIATKTSTIAGRFPSRLAADYTPMPNALMDHADELGLGTDELVLVWALERHRRLMGDEVWPSRETLMK